MCNEQLGNFRLIGAAARISGVMPKESDLLGSAPASSNSETFLTLPICAAFKSGSPKSYCVDTIRQIVV